MRTVDRTASTSSGRLRATIESIVHDLVPRWPFDRCRETSVRIVTDLSRLDIPSVLVQHTGHLVDRPRADPRWMRIPRSSWTHWVVEIPSMGMHLDATFAQFDHDHEGPRIMSIEEAVTEWTSTYR